MLYTYVHRQAYILYISFFFFHISYDCLTFSGVCALVRMCYIYLRANKLYFILFHIRTVPYRNRVKMEISLFKCFHITIFKLSSLMLQFHTMMTLTSQKITVYFILRNRIAFRKIPFEVLNWNTLLLFILHFSSSHLCSNGINIKLISTYYDWHCF